jgi:hypothetical protein
MPVVDLNFFMVEKDGYVVPLNKIVVGVKRCS